MNALLLRIAAVLVLLVAAFGGGFAAGHHVAAQAGALAMQKHLAADAAAKLDATEKARHLEQLQADTFAAQAAKYEKDKTDAQADADRTIADLRAGNLRLRAAWRCPAAAHLPAAAASAAQPDAAADDRAASAGRIVRAAADADAQIRGLQAILIEERRQ